MLLSISRIIPALAVIITLTTLILSTTTPALGTAWHQTTAWGHLAGSAPFRIAMIGIAFVTLQAIAVCWSSWARSARLAGIFSALAPLLLAASPASVLTTDASLLRSPVPMADLAASENLRVQEPGWIAAPKELRKIAQLDQEDIASASLERKLVELQSPKEVADSKKTRDLKAARRKLETEKPTFNCIVIDPTHPSGERKIPGCQETLDAKRAEINQRIDTLDRQIARQSEKDIARAQGDQAERHTTTRAAQTALSIQRDAVTWSRLISALALTSCILVALLAPTGSWLLFGLPIILASVAVTSPYFEASPRPDASWLAIFASLVVIETLLLGALLFRAFVTHNADLWQRLTRGQLAKLLGISFIYWAPLAVVAGLAGYFHLQYRHQTVAFAYTLPLPHQEALAAPPDRCDPNSATTLVFTPETLCDERDLERDIRISINHWSAETSRTARREVAATGEAADQSVETVVARSLEAFDRSVPERLRTQKIAPNTTGWSPAFNYDDCSFWEIKCRVWRAIAIALDDQYTSSRNKLRTSLENNLRSAAAKTGEVTGKSVAAADAAIISSIEQLRMELSRQVFMAFRFSEVTAAVASLLAAIAIVKSFGFILGRTVFSRPELHQNVPMGPRSGAKEAGRAVLVSDKGGMPIHSEKVHYVRFGTDVEGAIPKGFLLYQPYRQFLVRMLPFRHAFQYFKPEPAKNDVSLPCGNVQRIIRIELSEHERIGYYPKYLHGFVGEPRLISTWSLRIGSILQGRIRVHMVEGPGTVFLKSYDEPKLLSSSPSKDGTSGAGKGSSGITPSRLMAWTEGTDLDIVCDRGFLSFYTSTAHVRGAKGGFALFDGPSGKNRFGGALTFVPTLLLPL